MSLRTDSIADPEWSRQAGEENFPVGSKLIAAALRPDVAAYYAFARTADDIADSHDLGAAAKIRRLDAMARALEGGAAPAPEPVPEPEPEDDGSLGISRALALRRRLLGRGLPLDHGLELLEAFKQDATKGRYADWDELMAYCRLSAAPVGRFLLDLHGEPRSLYPAADALCHALQVINHLQDCGLDHRRLDRVYLPTAWLEAEGATVEDLARDRLTPGLRRVLDRCLEGTEALLGDSRRLARDLESWRLGLEVGAIQALGEDLCRRLRREDPLARRVAPARPVFLVLGLAGVLRHAAARLFR